MPDLLLYLLGCAVLLAIAGGPVVAMALRRMRRIESELRALRSELRALQPREEEPAGPMEGIPQEPRAAVEPLRPPRVARIEEPAPPRPTAEAHRPAPRATLDWERWVGVRGAAVVGGGFLALAAIFFFQHAFTQGWIAPGTRVVCGLLVGCGGLIAAAYFRRLHFGWTPSALEGAGVVALYASVWAADQRYGLISIVLSFPAMALITGLACALAVRHGSLFSALLGLAGGFATPLLLADSHGRTLLLFGYLLLLDLGLLFVARRRDWSSIGLCALGGTFLFELLWFFARGERPWPGLLFAAGFALMFAFSGPGTRALERRWLATQAFGVLLQFPFAFHFAARLELGAHVWPTAPFLALLVAAAAVVARRQNVPWLASAAAVASVAVVALWVFGLDPRGSKSVTWELAGVGFGLAFCSHALAEWERARGAGQQVWRRGAAASACAWALLFVAAAWAHRLVGFRPLVLGTGAIALLLLRQAHLLGRAAFAWCAGLALGLALGIAHGGYSPSRVDPGLPAPFLFWALPVALAAVLFSLPRAVRGFERSGPQAAGALLLSCAVVAVLWPANYLPTNPGPLALAAVPFGGLLLLFAARLASSAWVAASVGVTLLLIYATFGHSIVNPPDGLFLLLAAGPALVLVLAGFLSRELGERRWAWAFLATLVPNSVFAIDAAWTAAHGEHFEAGPSLVLGLPAAFSALILRARHAPAHAIGWMSAAAALAATSGFADQLDVAEFAVSCALFAAALAWIAQGLGLAGAGWSALACALLATLVLLAAAFVPSHYECSEALFLNWISYAHLVPAAAVGVVLRLEPPASMRGRSARRGLLGGCVLALLFVLLNLSIENAFADTQRLDLGAAGGHARDLCTSLAWGLFAGVLLVLGTARRATGLRWASLSFFVLSIGKVFLYDLAHLDGLYRVASLAGLACSLLAVSLFYQRFVFGRLEAGARA